MTENTESVVYGGIGSGRHSLTFHSVAQAGHGELASRDTGTADYQVWQIRRSTCVGEDTTRVSSPCWLLGRCVPLSGGQTVAANG